MEGFGPSTISIAPARESLPNQDGDRSVSHLVEFIWRYFWWLPGLAKYLQPPG
jgi:hypothetical protein